MEKDTEVDEEPDITDEEAAKIEEIAARSRKVYDEETGHLDLSKLRVTDLKENKRVILPKALNATEEAKIEVRLDALWKEFKEYVKEECKEDGSQESNLSHEQLLGLQSLRKKIKEEGLLVVPTDKSGKLCVTNKETYLKMGTAHTKGDQEVEPEEVERIQRVLNGHIAMLTKGFSEGETGNMRRGSMRQ